MRMLNLFVIAFFILSGCSENRPESTKNNQPESLPSPKTSVSSSPSFGVNVILSEQAKLKIEQAHESIRVFGYISGVPKSGVKKSEIDEMGMVLIFGLDMEKDHAGLFQFSNLELPAKKLKLVEGPDYEMLINVCSGRKSSPDNLLDCGVYQGNTRNVQSRTMDIHCRLIGEKIERPIEATVR